MRFDTSLNDVYPNFVSPLHVSVIIPVWCSQELLPRALDSLELQSIDSMEAVIVVDEAKESLDLNSLGHYKFRIRTIHCPRHIGTYAARRYGFNYSYGRYIFHLDSDDEINDCLGKMLECFPADIISFCPGRFSAYGAGVRKQICELGLKEQPLARSLLSRNILTRAYALLDQIISPDTFCIYCEDGLLFWAVCCAMESGRHWYNDEDIGELKYNHDNPLSVCNSLSVEEKEKAKSLLKKRMKLLVDRSQSLSYSENHTQGRGSFPALRRLRTR